ncbi:MAG TPA: efflux RND transporter periplasmic adaptor subunit [Steroidobacteraceae bacterium]|nr:efflux RND transporter periplasmic adaptor subunit [Steroidobacteraceae bacterium]
MSSLYTNANNNAAAARAPWLLAAAGLAAAGLAGCHGGPATAAPPAAVVALPVHAYSGADGGQSLRYPVEAAARYANPMSFRVAGKIIERAVRLGDLVRRGTVVARLDAADAEKQAAAARAALDAAEHRLTFAQQTLDRDNAQFAQHLIAESALEQTQDAYAAARSARDQAADQWVVARNALQYHALTADHDGFITSENADTGQYVAAGQAVYGLAWSGDADVNLDAAAADLGRITIGQHADVTFSALPGRRFAARVREIAPSADPQSRTYRVKLTLAGGQDAAAVRLGMTGDAVFSPASSAPASSGDAQALDRARAAATTPIFKIPATAIFHQGSAPAVWVIRAADSTLELRPVTVRTYTERAAVVTTGLAEGDNLVLAGVHTVFAGQHVRAIQPLFADDGADVGQ